MTNHKTPPENPELIRIGEVSELTTISKSHIPTLARQGKFPKSRKLGANTSVWLKSEVIQWIKDRLGLDGNPKQGGNV